MNPFLVQTSGNKPGGLWSKMWVGGEWCMCSLSLCVGDSKSYQSFQWCIERKVAGQLKMTKIEKACGTAIAFGKGVENNMATITVGWLCCIPKRKKQVAQFILTSQVTSIIMFSAKISLVFWNPHSLAQSYSTMLKSVILPSGIKCQCMARFIMQSSAEQALS